MTLTLDDAKQQFWPGTRYEWGWAAVAYLVSLLILQCGVAFSYRQTNICFSHFLLHLSTIEFVLYRIFRIAQNLRNCGMEERP